MTMAQSLFFPALYFLLKYTTNRITQWGPHELQKRVRATLNAMLGREAQPQSQCPLCPHTRLQRLKACPVISVTDEPMASAAVGIQVSEELEARGNELQGQNFELQSWCDLGHRPAWSINHPYPFVCVLSQSLWMQTWPRRGVSGHEGPNLKPGRSGPLAWV